VNILQSLYTIVASTDRVYNNDEVCKSQSYTGEGGYSLLTILTPTGHVNYQQV
jgi:hypothetical protein